MDSNITLGLAFVAGLASFLSPCVLSLVPAYVGYLGGRTAGAGEDGSKTRWLTLSHGLAFVVGFSVVFILLGIATSALGGLLYDMRNLLSKVGGIVVIVFGIHMIGIYRIPFLEYDLRRQNLPDQKWGYLSSALMGVFFSAGWSPCVGPVLGAILTVVFNGGSIWFGVTMLSAYSAGLAIPFLIAALGIGWVTTLIRRYGKVMRYVEIVMGVLLVIVGAMLFLGTFETLARFGVFIDFGL
jgi:cytochrome c-type biogenesis protein